MFGPGPECVVLITLLGAPFRSLSDRQTNFIGRDLSVSILEENLQRTGSSRGRKNVNLPDMTVLTRFMGNVCPSR